MSHHELMSSADPITKTTDSWRRPELALLIFGSLFLGSIGVLPWRIVDIPITVSKLIALVALLAWGTSMWSRPASWRLAWNPYTGPLVAMVMSMALATPHATDLMKALSLVITTALLTCLAQIVHAHAHPMRLEALITRCCWVVAGAMVLTLIFQGQTTAHQPDHAWVHRGHGTFQDANIWCTTLLVVIPPLLGVLSSSKARWIPWGVVILVALTTASIVHSTSRAGLIAAAILAPGLAWLLRERRGALIAGGLLGLVLASWVVPVEATSVRYQTLLYPELEGQLGHGSLIWRQRLFWAGLQVISDHPWWGVGLTNFPQAVSHYMSNEPSFVAHNTFINVWAEQGLPGVIAHGWLGITVMRQSWLLNQSSIPLISKLGGGLMLSWTVFAIMASTLNLCTLGMAYFVLGLSLSAAEHDTSILELVKQPRYPHNGPLESSG